MSFTFFTFGGSQFWEDVFFYQKWRIQRHFRSKEYRLLDNWDIRRASGSFEDCRKAFIKYIEAYEIPRQTGELVILLHGLGENKSIFRNLWTVLTKNGYNVAAINYPSTRKSMKDHIRQLEFFMTHCEDVEKVSFITKGTSSLLLRMLISDSYGWQEKFKVNKVININPANRGSDALELMSRFKIFNFMFGPMLKDVSPLKAQSISTLPADISLGLIFCPTWGNIIFRPIIERFKGLPLKSDVTEESFADEVINIPNTYYNIFNNTDLCNACVKFLKDSRFK